MVKNLSRFGTVLLLASGVACAAPCPNLVGEWNFELKCVGVTPPAFFGDRFAVGTITAQTGCVFAGTLNGATWVGAVHGDSNRDVSSDYGGAKATGELSRKRDGLFREMSFTYTYSGDELGAPPTACTGVGTRD